MQGLRRGVLRGSGVVLCEVCGFEGIIGLGVVEDAAPDPTEALFGQDASLDLRYAQHISFWRN